MAIIRTDTEQAYNIVDREVITNPNEWVEQHSQERIDDKAWIARYEYEGSLIEQVYRDFTNANILELGSGPGKLGDIMMSKDNSIKWTNVDKSGALALHKERKFKGKFLVKDLMNTFAIDTDYDKLYDVIVANDFLEHIANPSDVLYQAHKITHDDSKFFISVPNWRMGHEFIYRGLFDYDNWVYTMWVHGWEVEQVFKSNLICNSSSKLSSESDMPDELIDSWNFYFVGKKRK